MDGVNGSQSAPTELPLKYPRNRELLGGDVLAQSLFALGMRVAFGLHGGHLDAFLMGCHDMNVPLIDTRHEAVAINAAQGYSKVTGKAGVCFVTANSGFSNALPGLASALADRSPIFCVTSSPPLQEAETNSLQGFHQQDIIAKPLSKFAHRVTNVEEIPRLVAHAYRTAIAAPPGPVVVDFPIDVLFTPPSESRISWGAIARPLPYSPGPDPEPIRMTIELLKQAQRPCIITSTGARGEECGQELRKFVEATGVPLFNNQKHSGCLPNDHPLRGGVAACLAMLPATGQKQPDVLLLLGARTGFLLGSRSGAVLPNKDCKLIQIDVDGSEIGRSHSIDVGIVSDATLAVKALNAELQKSGPVTTPFEWQNAVVSLKNSKSPHQNDDVDVSGRVHPYHGIKKIFESLEPECNVIIDGGEASCWSAELVDQYARASFYTVATGYLGFLGNGWGYALGVAVAEPDKQVINIQGDGSAGFYIAELESYARHGLNILTVIVNNACWGMSQNGIELVYGKTTDARPATKLSEVTAYETVAGGFGCAGARVDKYSDIEKAVKKLSQGQGPGCINLITSDKPMAGATKSFVNPTDDPNVIVVPYYDNLPRPFYK